MKHPGVKLMRLTDTQGVHMRGHVYWSRHLPGFFLIRLGAYGSPRCRVLYVHLLPVDWNDGSFEDAT